MFKSNKTIVLSPLESVLTVALQVTLTACVVHAYSYAAAKGWALASKDTTAKAPKAPKAEAAKTVEVTKVD